MSDWARAIDATTLGCDSNQFEIFAESGILCAIFLIYTCERYIPFSVDF